MCNVDADTNMYEKSRSDFCRLRFKTDGFSRLYAMSKNTKTPGKILYDSSEWVPMINQPSTSTDLQAKFVFILNPLFAML